jgi:addiction module HigA family antidote
MGRMFNPPHPGETIREDILPALGLSVTEAAEQLGVSRVSFSRVINGKAAISPIMARRLEAWLNGPEYGPSAESWLRGQLAYDLWQAEQAPAPRVQAVSNRRPSGDPSSATLCASSRAQPQSSKRGRRKTR